MKADPFRPRRSSKPDGAGIGLSVTQALVQLMGQVVEVMQRGYRSDDQVIRPARVVVSQ